MASLIYFWKTVFRSKKNELDLRGAFPDMPDSCYTALMDSASSVQEGTRTAMPVRRLILVAAAVMLMVAAGVTAAVKSPGWSDLLERFGLTVPEKAREIIDMLGAERFFFATDFPMWDAAGELERFNAINLTEREREMIFGENIKRLLRLD